MEVVRREKALKPSLLRPLRPGEELTWRKLVVRGVEGEERHDSPFIAGKASRVRLPVCGQWKTPLETAVGFLIERDTRACTAKLEQLRTRAFVFFQQRSQKLV